MGDLRRDIRFGVRMLLRHPAVTIISVVTLALGIGATTAVFSLVNATLLTPLPFDDPHELVMLYSAKPSAGYTTQTISLPDFRDWAAEDSVIEDAGILARVPVNVMGTEHPDRLLAMRASAGVLRSLGVSPALGRAYDASSDDPAAEPLVLLSDATWRNRYGADPEVVGTTMSIDGVAHEVIGVLPPEVAAGTRAFDLWTPFTFGGERFEARAQRSFASIARLRDGVTPEAADRAMKVIGDRLAELYPESNRGQTVNVFTLNEMVLGRGTRPTMYVLSAAVAFVLLIACVNIANLLLATAGSREREFAVRTALGADSRHLVKQLLAESTLLTLIGGALGIAVAYWCTGILAAGMRATIGRTPQFSVDGRALAFTVLVLVITALGIGIPVALRASRARFSGVIHESARGATATARETLRRDALVIGQVALALALMIGAGLMIRSLLALRAVDPGFDTHNLLRLRVSLPGERYPSEEQQLEFFERAEEQLRALPGVRSVASVGCIPLVGDSSNSALNIEDFPISNPADRFFVGNHSATPGYLETMGISLLEGREFTPMDRADTQGVIIVNKLLAERFWPNQSALGKRVKFGRLDGEEPWLEIVGVMADYHQTSLDIEPRLETLYPQAYYTSSGMDLVIRSEIAPERLIEEAQAVIWKIDPELAIYNIETMDQILDRNVRSADDLANLLGGFGIVALVLALGGLYGMLSFSVGQRTQEIGVRMALGAESRAVVTSILGKTAALVAAGIVAGGVIAWLMSRWLGEVLFETSSVDPITYASVCVGMLVVGLLAGLIPALKASRVDPVVALRCD
jgi:putative ABC transport system permease protein